MSLPEPLTAAGATALQAIIDSPSDTLLATDFYGTLAPIVDDPDQAYADPDAVAALRRLGYRIGPVVIITGRPARTAVRLGHGRRRGAADEEDALTELSDVIVDGPRGLATWLTELAAQLGADTP